MFYAASSAPKISPYTKYMSVSNLAHSEGKTIPKRWRRSLIPSVDVYNWDSVFLVERRIAEFLRNIRELCGNPKSSKSLTIFVFNVLYLGRNNKV